MRKIKAFISILLVAFVILLFGRASSVEAAYDFSDRRTFIIFMSEYYESGSYQWYLQNDGEFAKQFNWFTSTQKAGYNSSLKLDGNYPWADTSPNEFRFITKYQLVNWACGSEALAERAARDQKESGRYDAIQAEKDRAANAALKKKIDKMWKDSVLVGDDKSHGILAPNQKQSFIYQRQEGNTYQNTKKGTHLPTPNIQTEKTSGATKMIMEFLCWGTYTLAYKLDAIMSGAGIALDNVIFGRVAGYGVILPGENDQINLYGFELENGNPYGYVAAMLFQKFRMFAYVFMALFCFYKLIKIAIGNDYAKMKMDLGTFLTNAGLSFSFIVFMPYVLDIFLYIRDIILRAVAFKSLEDMFDSTGFLDSFQKGAETASKIDFIPNALYLGAVILSLFMAGIYIAYAMSMMIHFIFFPFVCLRGISDRNAFKEWASETVGLTIMPVVDGMLLMMPLTFSKMANGNTAFNLLALIASAMLLTARGQVRRTLGIKENGLLDMKALGTVLGLAQAAKGVAKAAGGAAKKIGGAGVDAAKGTADAIQNAKTAKAYKAMDAEEGGASGEDHVTDPNERTGAGPEPTPVTGGAGVTNPASGEASVSPSFGAGSADGVAAMSGGMGGAMPNLARYANIDNFDKFPFRGSLDNATMAKMYQKRATRSGLNAASKVFGAAGSAAGGLLAGAGGAAIGAAAGSFLGGGAMMGLAGAGMELGSEVGSIAGNAAYAIPRAAYYGDKGASSVLGAMGHGLYKLVNTSVSGSTNIDNHERKLPRAEGEIVGAEGGPVAMPDALQEPVGVSDDMTLPRPSFQPYAQVPAYYGEGGSIDGSTPEDVCQKNLEFMNYAMNDYNSALATVEQEYKNPHAFDNNSEMQLRVGQTQTKIAELLKRSANGEKGLLKGKNGFHHIKNEFDNYKQEIIKADMITELKSRGIYEENNVSDRFASDYFFNKATQKADRKGGKAGYLRSRGKFLSNEYDKEMFGIDWNEVWKELNKK